MRGDRLDRLDQEMDEYRLRGTLKRLRYEYTRAMTSLAIHQSAQEHGYAISQELRQTALRFLKTAGAMRFGVHFSCGWTRAEKDSDEGAAGHRRVRVRGRP